MPRTFGGPRQLLRMTAASSAKVRAAPSLAKSWMPAMLVLRSQGPSGHGRAPVEELFPPIISNANV
eukprot:10040044-Alexandrium_andersonii.AAC.1